MQLMLIWTIIGQRLGERLRHSNGSILFIWLSTMWKIDSEEACICASCRCFEDSLSHRAPRRFYM